MKIGEEWFHFSQPHCVITTDEIKDVQGAIREIEQLVNRKGWYAAGFVGYEAAPAFDKAFQVVDSKDFPLLWFGLYGNPMALQLPAVREKPFDLEWHPSVERKSYITAIEEIKDQIAHGNTYQVNYTMRLHSRFEDDAWEFFLDLVQGQNKYAAFIDTGRFAICSASPELFFHLDDEHVTSRPMKGTGKRGRTTIEDRILADWLLNSGKNRAENVMIVDMIRNDLGRIARIGSVDVPDLFSIEKYPTLFQMTSTVRAGTNASLAKIFEALFPCASITGAPKVSTMKIISKLETTPRRIYTGSIGYFGPDRKAQFNVAIRTALIDRDKRQIEYGAGGGIVWDSTGEDEYEEALLKARVLMERPRQFSLLETILWTPQEGYFLLNAHILRMTDSASYFDFVFPQEELESRLRLLAADFISPKRIRVLLNKTGMFTAEVQDHKPQNNPCNVRLADLPVNSRDVFLFHKTTERRMYSPSALLVNPPPEQESLYDDILLFNENRELTEFTIGNLVVGLEDGLFTPPSTCGLLAGTFRTHLLEKGKIRERVIHKDELGLCGRMFLINSVRKWVEVTLWHEGA